MTQHPPTDEHVHPDVERQLSDLKVSMATMVEAQANSLRESTEFRAWIRENMVTKAQVSPLIRIGWGVGMAVVVSIVTALLALVLKPGLIG